LNSFRLHPKLIGIGHTARQQQSVKIIGLCFG
jgi:hypothetical protein